MKNRITLYNGCSHYKRLCSFFSPCCERVYHCQICHDKDEKHKVENKLINEIVCDSCNTKQNISNKCIKCDIIFGSYYCNICVLWCNINSDIFHCKLCGFCRIGKSNSYFHCTICNACIEIGFINDHRHVENTLKSDCPICAEYLFTSRKDSILLRCGHSIHTECYTLYAEKSLQCPICMKSLGCMKFYGKKIEKLMKHVVEINKKRILWTCEITCYDCGGTSMINYKYLFNKCLKCDSYNTRLNVINKNNDDSSFIDMKK